MAHAKINRATREEKEAAYLAFKAADEAWSAELERLFGKRAGDVRYTKEAQGRFTNENGREELGRLYLAFDKARMAWGRAFF